MTDGAAPRDPPGEGRSGDGRPPLRPSVPRSFQNRLTIAFVGLVALTLALVAPVVVNRLDDYFRQQEEQSLRVRAGATAAILDRFIEDSIGSKAVVIEATSDGKRQEILNPDVSTLLVDRGLLTLLADNVAQADISIEFGMARLDTDGVLITDPAPGLDFQAALSVDPVRGQARDPAITPARWEWATTNAVRDWGMIVTLSNPYTSRASTLAAIAGLLLVMASLAVLVAILLAAFIAHRFTTPLTRLTEVSRRLAEGDLSSRVPADGVSSSTLELRALSQQFNTMADRLEESVRIIRRDRDLSRDFLADVSHELRTPIAAMRTFVELLQGPAGMDSAARSEFLDSSAVQLDRLDWLAQNLLELSKLDSGLVLLDLRPEDIRGTIESAVEQQVAASERRGVRLTTTLPGRPLRIRHDPPRVGQVVTNLVGNALKFTPRGGEVRVSASADGGGGARIEVEDSGVGIDESELPKIFDRFYRGSEANEARSTGSGLGLAIVKSIVDMHHGTIAVESRVGHGTRFVVSLPRDPRDDGGVPPPADGRAASTRRKVDDSSPITASAVNPDAATLVTTPDRLTADPPNPRERSTPTQ
jgi:signal transduction histidine kinase